MTLVSFDCFGSLACIGLTTCIPVIRAILVLGKCPELVSLDLTPVVTLGYTLLLFFGCIVRNNGGVMHPVKNEPGSDRIPAVRWRPSLPASPRNSPFRDVGECSAC